MMKTAVRELLRSATFALRTREEAAMLADVLATYFPSPDVSALAIVELLLNAVEHGNLELGGELKARLLRAGTLDDEIEHRLSVLPFCERRVRVVLSVMPTAVAITDDGVGFDWRPFFEPRPPSTAPNGRGLLLARTLGSVDIEFSDAGNRVVVRPR